MGMQVGDRSGGPMADINVTPLVDVVLVLLIIFMVITHLLGSGVAVPYPKQKRASKFVMEDSTWWSPSRLQKIEKSSSQRA